MAHLEPHPHPYPSQDLVEEMVEVVALAGAMVYLSVEEKLCSEAQE